MERDTSRPTEREGRTGRKFSETDSETKRDLQQHKYNERERDRQRQGDRQTDRQTDRDGRGRGESVRRLTVGQNRDLRQHLVTIRERQTH